MVKAMFVIFTSVIGLPVYAFCVILLLALGAIFGWSYVDASVYVCEYFQPIFTALLAIVFMSLAIRKIYLTSRLKLKTVTAGLFLLNVTYLVISILCFKELFNRLSTYSGMNNRQIFDIVVAKLGEMGSIYPVGRFHIFTGSQFNTDT